MQKTAEIFMDQGHQAIRLPQDIHLSGEQVLIRQDERTGDLIVSAFSEPKRSGDFERLFHLLDEIGPAPEAFMVGLCDPVLEAEDVF